MLQNTYDNILSKIVLAGLQVLLSWAKLGMWPGYYIMFWSSDKPLLV